MAVRDFVDTRGTKWKVWPVTPDTLQPITAAEDYLGDYSEGWLCFESNVERRRLAKYPPNWADLSDNGLNKLLKEAEVAPPKKGTLVPKKGEIFPP